MWHVVNLQNTSCEQAEFEDGGVLVYREGWGHAGQLEQASCRSWACGAHTRGKRKEKANWPIGVCGPGLGLLRGLSQVAYFGWTKQPAKWAENTTKLGLN